MPYIPFDQNDLIRGDLCCQALFLRSLSLNNHSYTEYTPNKEQIISIKT